MCGKDSIPSLIISTTDSFLNTPMSEWQVYDMNKVGS